MYKELDATV